MTRLLFADLGAEWRLWLGASVAILAAAVLGALDAVFFATAAAIGGDGGRDMGNANGIIAMFNGVTAIVVISSVSTLTVALARRQHALWQLVGVTPRRVTEIVLGQVAVLGMVCGILGTVIAFPLAQPAFNLLAETISTIAGRGYQAQFPLPAAIWTIVIITLVALASALHGARRAARVRPIEALRELEYRERRMSWGRWVVVGLCITIGTPLTLTVVNASAMTGMSAVPMLGPVLTATFSALTPVLLPSIVRAWTSIVPARLSPSWYLARANALHKLSVSSSVVSPILTAGALVGGLFTAFATLSNAMFIETGRRPSDADSTALLIMLGGPVLLAAIGAGMTIMMSARSRERDLALLAVAGGTRRSAIQAAAFESLIYTATAMLGAMIIIVVQGLLTAGLLSVQVPGTTPTIEFVPMLLVSIAGLVLVTLATVIPVIVRSRHTIVRRLMVV